MVDLRQILLKLAISENGAVPKGKLVKDA